MTEQEANDRAKELSIKHWDKHIHVYDEGNGEFSLGMYWEEKAKMYYLKGEGKKHTTYKPKI